MSHRLFDLKTKLLLVFGSITLVLAMQWGFKYVPEFFHVSTSKILTDKDFANYWIASRLSLEGKTYDVFGPWEVYFSHMQVEFGADYQWRAWSYPPSYLLLMLPLGLMTYPVAAALFIVATSALMVFSMRRATPPMSKWAWLIAGPAIMINLFSFQNGFMTAAFVLGALFLRDSRPIAAGVFLGLLTIKPQLGVLFPMLMLFEKRWSVIVTATITAALLIAVSAAVFGWDAWYGYIVHNAVYQKGVMMEATGIFILMMPSVFGWLRGLEINSAVAMTMHMGVAIPIALVVVLAMYRETDFLRRSALLLVGTFIISPYSLYYDLIPLSFVLGALILRNMNDGAKIIDLHMALWALTALIPVYIVKMSNLGVPLAQFALIGCAASLCLHAFGNARLKPVLHASASN